MPFTLTMPKLSPTMEEGTITKWQKKVGDFVKAGDVVFEVATDKATVEYNALDEGYLRQILVPEGGEAIVNQSVAIFTEKKEESIEGYMAEGLPPKSKTPKPAEPQAAATPTEESKAAPASPSKTGLAQPVFAPEPPLEHYEFNVPTGEISGGRILASPLARRLAKEKGIDLSTLKGSGPNHRIMSRDLDKGQPSGVAAFGKREVPTLAPGSYEEETLSPMRKVIATRLQESKTFIPHFYIAQEVMADSLFDVREQLKNMGIKVSFNDLVVRATALALREHPEANSGFNSVNNTIIRFKTIDISIAVSLPTGLITPIVRHADFKNVGQLSTEIKQLAARARDGKLVRDEYVGGSFTISNLGMFGVTEFYGVINPPQAAILCIGGIEEKPLVKDQQVKIGKTMRITLSVDHRVLDGADAAKFIKTVQKYLENPAILLVQ
jgi:pyruvate dehydrogenase E2 component (dihydrolipoamide acetyltransferase)